MEENRPVALWKLGLAVVGFVLAIDLADTLGGWWTIAVGVMTFATFTYAGWRWGRDSRDGADWVAKPKVIEEDDEGEPRPPGALDVTLWHRWP